ncbi:hypothetical protein OH76DRAFT_797597 [Lentinus brumalis]|uniref:Uncharacterized protein n=1 Tax=Lentinus brumalis TaxID=2498619 RepID=A0A371D3Q1_9APHY|nr:hypothetical protein OH76DRAFT_797597 [Polyporus brumalis]
MRRGFLLSAPREPRKAAPAEPPPSSSSKPSEQENKSTPQVPSTTVILLPARQAFSSPSPPVYKIVPIDGAGLGMVAIRGAVSYAVGERTHLVCTMLGWRAERTSGDTRTRKGSAHTLYPWDGSAHTLYPWDGSTHTLYPGMGLRTHYTLGSPCMARATRTTRHARTSASPCPLLVLGLPLTRRAVNASLKRWTPRSMHTSPQRYPCNRKAPVSQRTAPSTTDAGELASHARLDSPVTLT